MNDPENWMKSISSFLDVTFDTDMLKLYEGIKNDGWCSSRFENGW